MDERLARAVKMSESLEDALLIPFPTMLEILRFQQQKDRTEGRDLRPQMLLRGECVQQVNEARRVAVCGIVSGKRGCGTRAVYKLPKSGFAFRVDRHSKNIQGNIKATSVIILLGPRTSHLTQICRHSILPASRGNWNHFARTDAT